VWVAFGCGVVFYDFAQFSEVYFGLLEERSVELSDFEIFDVEKPGREPTEVPFCTYIGPGSEKDFHVIDFSKFQKVSEIFILG
jgi:hypothetical protein